MRCMTVNYIGDTKMPNTLFKEKIEELIMNMKNGLYSRSGGCR